MRDTRSSVGRDLSKRGSAALIVVILVLGYMVSISFSHSYMVNSEVQGAGARTSNKKAYCAAFAGLQFVMSCLRQDPNTFTVHPPNNIRYFSQNLNDANNHWCTSPAGANKTYSPTTFVKGIATFSCSTAFSVNQDVDPDKYSFILCSYPGLVASQTYWVKVIGQYESPAGLSQCQLWGEILIDQGQEIVSLHRFGQVRVQTTVRATGALVDDFWDWQSY